MPRNTLPSSAPSKAVMTTIHASSASISVFHVSGSRPTRYSPSSTPRDKPMTPPVMPPNAAPNVAPSSAVKTVSHVALLLGITFLSKLHFRSSTTISSPARMVLKISLIFWNTLSSFSIMGPSSKSKSGAMADAPPPPPTDVVVLSLLISSNAASASVASFAALPVASMAAASL